MAAILRRKTRMKRRNRRTRENQIPSQKRRKRSQRLVVRKSHNKRKVT